MIAPELSEFLQTGLSLLVGTRAEDLTPECTRAMGLRVEEGGRQVTVFLPTATSATTIENLRENGRIAVTASRPEDHRTVQLKGTCLEIREAGESDRLALERYRVAFAETLLPVGLPPRLTLRLAYWPCTAVRFEVVDLFVQTPGPGAGAPMAGGGRP